MTCTRWECKVCGTNNHILEESCSVCGYPSGTEAEDVKAKLDDNIDGRE